MRYDSLRGAEEEEPLFMLPDTRGAREEWVCEGWRGSSRSSRSAGEGLVLGFWYRYRVFVWWKEWHTIIGIYQIIVFDMGLVVVLVGVRGGRHFVVG